MINSYLNGAISLAAWTISLFFFRFYRSTGERLFVFFAVAYALLGLERLAIEFLPGWFGAHVYLIRLVAFLILLFGILDKNRKDEAG